MSGSARESLQAAVDFLDNVCLSDVCPPCDQELAKLTFFYAAGLMGDRHDALVLAGRVQRMHLHRSDLYVVTEHVLSEEESDNLQQAWTEVAGGARSAVMIVAPDSQVWQGIAKTLK